MSLKKLNADAQAQEIVQQCFLAALQAMAQLGVHPDRMVTPWMEMLASLHATVKMRGGKADKAELCAALSRECDAAVQRILAQSGQLPAGGGLIAQ